MAGKMTMPEKDVESLITSINSEIKATKKIKIKTAARTIIPIERIFFIRDNDNSYSQRGKGQTLLRPDEFIVDVFAMIGQLVAAHAHYHT